MESKTLVSYIRDPETRAPNGLVIALDRDTIGWSLLNRKVAVDIEVPFTLDGAGGAVVFPNATFGVSQDRWDKEKAFDKALTKAHTGVDWIAKIQAQLNDTKNPLSPKTAKRFREDLLPALERMKDRAKRYFKK